MKQKINFIIDVMMFLLLAAISGLGFLMKYVLVPGKDRLAKFGSQVDLYYLGWDRHEWGEIHLILGLIMIGLLVLHIILHWSIVKSFFRKLICNEQFRKPLTILFSLLCVFLFIFPFLIKIEIKEVLQGEGHHSLHQSVQSDVSVRQKASNIISTNVEKQQYASKHKIQQDDNISSHHISNISIHGYMTLQQVSQKYNIPVDSIVAGLNIHDLIPGNRQLVP